MIETRRFERGDRLVAGVDEAGRGPLAGPVVAAAVVLNRSAIPEGLNDSKKLDTADRERLFIEILGSATVSIASSSAGEIDRLNIRAATLLAMQRAIGGLALRGSALGAGRPCHVLIDGRDVPPGLLCPATAVVQGDARSLSIAAASIVAKVARDRMMARLCERFPVYGFGRHMGYGTRQHFDALARHGPCAFHRMTFRPIRQAGLDFA